MIYDDDPKSSEVEADFSDEYGRRLKEEALRQAVKELEHRVRVDEELRRRASEHVASAEDEARLRLENDTLRQAAEELAYQRAEATRIEVEKEARIRNEEHARAREEEHVRMRAEADEEVRADEQRRLEAEEQARLTAEEEARIWAEEETQRQAAATTLNEEPRSAEASPITAQLMSRFQSSFEGDRASALFDLARIGGDEAFRAITGAFDDVSPEVRNAAARALFDLQPDRAASFTMALRQGSVDRRRRIGAALAESGLAQEAISNLMAENRETTYDAFSVLFLMAKAGEVKPLMKAIEELLDVEARLAVVKLLALSEQAEIIPAFRRLAVRGSLPSEVRSAVMEAIYQISSQTSQSTPA